MEMVHIGCVAATHTLCLPILSTNEKHHQGYINNYILLIQAQEELLHWPFLSIPFFLKFWKCVHAMLQSSVNLVPSHISSPISWKKLWPRPSCSRHFAVAQESITSAQKSVFLMLFSLLRLFSYVGKVLPILFFFCLTWMSLHWHPLFSF